MHYVIIGNSAAAVGCIEGIRSVDRAGKITVISGEVHHTYSRPLISYLLCGKTTREKMKYRDDHFYQSNDCTTILGHWAKAIDREKKQVLLDDGRTIAYDKLLLACGSHPIVPPLPGYDAVPNKFTFSSLDDALALENAIHADARVLIVGAGLIGLKCAEGIFERVKSVDIVDLGDRILSSILDADGAARVQRHLESLGMTFHLGTSVSAYTKDSAELTNGEQLSFDILVTAIGVRPNTALAADAGLTVNRGIQTDHHCMTNDPDIYAAGDCSESYDLSADTHRVLALLPNAYMQGECVGMHMAGSDKPYDRAIPMNAIGFAGLHIITAGSYIGERCVVEDGENYKVMFTEGNLLRGYMMIGDVMRAGIYTALIRNQTPLDTLDFALLKQNPQLMAFAASARKDMLTTVR